MTNYVMSSAPSHAMQPDSPGIAVTLTDGKIYIFSHTANLNIPGLPSLAIQYHISPELASRSLLYISLLCDQDCDAHFHNKFIKISLNGVTIITVTRNSNGL